MTELQKQIATDLLSIRAVYFRPEQPFTWASGIKSPVYCDNRLTLTAPAVRTHVEEGLAQLIRENYPDAAASGVLERPESLFAHVMRRALARNASDIHVSPTDAETLIRLRTDGRLQTDLSVPAAVAAEFVSYIKVLANLDIAEKRAPQDGSIDTKVNGLEVSLRVATAPTIHGEHVTLRILSQTREARQLDSLENLRIVRLGELDGAAREERLHALDGREIRAVCKADDDLAGFCRKRQRANRPRRLRGNQLQHVVRRPYSRYVNHVLHSTNRPPLICGSPAE